MPPLPEILNDYIIKTKEKLNQSNLKTYCKCCIEALGEEGKRTCFPNKTDRIVLHLKKCTYFSAKTTPEIRNKIFSLITKNNDLEDSELLGKRKCKQLNLLFFYASIFYYKLFSELFFLQLHHKVFLLISLMIQLLLLYLFPILPNEKLSYKVLLTDC